MNYIKKILQNKRKVIIKISFVFLILIGVLYTGIGVYSYVVVSAYENKILPNIYVGNHSISTENIGTIKTSIAEIEKNILQTQIIFKRGTVAYYYTLDEIGVRINKKEILEEILDYQNKMSYFDKFIKIVDSKRKVFSYKLIFSDEDIIKTINTIKSKIDCKLVQGKLVMASNRQLSYYGGQASFSLDVNKTLEDTKNIINNMLTVNVIELIGKSETPKLSENSVIDTKISGFSTKYTPGTSREKNLITALNYIDGTIIKPGETFSFYNYAGPYSKKGYVYYLGIIGNGVCQVATTTYNAALLSGCSIVERHQHADKSVYVDGGLDATVASGINGINKVDFKFKNTLKYPIYISAYVKDEKVNVDFWSSSKATGGKIYKTESVKVGYLGFKTYLHVYKGGKEIEKRYLTTSWYRK